MNRGLLHIDPQRINLLPQIQDRVPINISLNPSHIKQKIPLLLLRPFLLINQQGVLILEIGYQVIKPEIISFQLSQFVDLSFEFVDEHVLLLVLYLRQLVLFYGGIGVVEILAVHDVCGVGVGGNYITYSFCL